MKNSFLDLSSTKRWLRVVKHPTRPREGDVVIKAKNVKSMFIKRNPSFRSFRTFVPISRFLFSQLTFPQKKGKRPNYKAIDGTEKENSYAFAGLECLRVPERGPRFPKSKSNNGYVVRKEDIKKENKSPCFVFLSSENVKRYFSFGQWLVSNFPPLVGSSFMLMVLHFYLFGRFFLVSFIIFHFHAFLNVFQFS